MQVKTRDELRKIIQEGIIRLETIDTSLITDMTHLFESVNKINGSIATWNTSSVINMKSMFENSKLNPDISKWNVSNVTNMEKMFYNSKFNRDISKWDVSSVTNMNYVFNYSKFDSDISSWDVGKVKTMICMFKNSPFNKDISKWDVSKVKDMSWMFNTSPFYQNLGAWDLTNKNTIVMFNFSHYSMEQYTEDRKNYLKSIELEKERLIEEENDKYLLEEKNRVNNELNKDIEISSLEMEF